MRENSITIWLSIKKLSVLIRAPYKNGIKLVVYLRCEFLLQHITELSGVSRVDHHLLLLKWMYHRTIHHHLRMKLTRSLLSIQRLNWGPLPKYSIVINIVVVACIKHRLLVLKRNITVFIVDYPGTEERIGYIPTVSIIIILVRWVNVRIGVLWSSRHGILMVRVDVYVSLRENFMRLRQGVKRIRFHSGRLLCFRPLFIQVRGESSLKDEIGWFFILVEKWIGLS